LPEGKEKFRRKSLYPWERISETGRVQIWKKNALVDLDHIQQVVVDLN
jgi:hypothetical protein